MYSEHFLPLEMHWQKGASTIDVLEKARHFTLKVPYRLIWVNLVITLVLRYPETDFAPTRQPPYNISFIDGSMR